VDELPQLWNVFKGEMSIVGPRPEVPRYVGMYTAEQKQVLSIKPGITDFASLQYFSENELLAAADDPERVYTQEIMPAKLALNMKYLRERNFRLDLQIIGQTIAKIFS
jgi:lipopolysaccharide/colanic/teichoic acid biosynthesis glycosyltransferase